MQKKTNMQIMIPIFGMLYLIVAGIIVMACINTRANEASHSFYYAILDEEDEYTIISANDGISGEFFTAPSLGNAIYDQLSVPAGQEICSWQVIKVEPDVGYLATPSDATPSDATPSDATPSDASTSGTDSEDDDSAEDDILLEDDVNVATDSDADPQEVQITEYPVYLVPGQSYSIESLMQYANALGQITLRPIYHDKHAYLTESVKTGETTRSVTYSLSFNKDVTYQGMLNGVVRVSANTVGTRTSFSITKPAAGTGNLLSVEAHYDCPYCSQEITLENPITIVLPEYEAPSTNDGGADDNNGTSATQPAPGGANGGSGGGSAGVEIKETKNDLLSIQYSAANRDGWYYAFPRLMIESAEGYQIYYQIWNTSLGQRQEQSPVSMYSGQTIFDQDGIYRCVIWVQKDESSERLQETTLEFKIDRAAPEILIHYDVNTVSNQEYYASARRATVTINEVNFSEKNVIMEPVGGTASGVWTHAGEKHTTMVLFKDDGPCALTVSCTDLAGRSSLPMEQQSFIIDTKPPSVTVSGVANLTANKNAVSPVITYEDENLDTSRSRIVLESYSNGEIKGKRKSDLVGGKVVCSFDPIEEDDNYTLTAQIYDKAGNLTEEKISFSVNQKGAVFVFQKKEIIGTYTNESFYPTIEVWNTDVMTVVSVTLNGQDVEYDYEDSIVRFRNPIEKDGKYVIGLEVKDTANNHSVMKPIEFFFDATRPVNLIQGVEDGGVYNIPVTITIWTEQRGDVIKEIYLNDQKVDNYKTDADGVVTLRIQEPGDYVLRVVSIDQAGNESDTRPISFAYELKVDTVTPAGSTKLHLASGLLAVAMTLLAVWGWRKIKKR